MASCWVCQIKNCSGRSCLKNCPTVYPKNRGISVPEGTRLSKRKVKGDGQFKDISKGKGFKWDSRWFLWVLRKGCLWGAAAGELVPWQCFCVEVKCENLRRDNVCAYLYHWRPQTREHLLLIFTKALKSPKMGCFCLPWNAQILQGRCSLWSPQREWSGATPVYLPLPIHTGSSN